MYSKGLDLLGLKLEERTKPFRGAAGAVHPMLTEAIVQFQAQAMKELMPSSGPVRTQIVGKETLDKAQQASRVQDFMNYQLTTVMEEYTPEFDQALFYLGYGGSVFKKVYYDRYLGRMVSKLVLADDLYIPYYGSSVMSQCSRVTHRVAMSTNEFKKRVLAGEYLDLDLQAEAFDPTASDISQAIDKQTGLTPSDEAEEMFLLEMHVDYDVPGFEDVDEDGEPTGIKLPFLITIEEVSGRVVGVRRNWEEDDDLKLRIPAFVHYVLVEGLGAYGLGFVHLIGGLSKTATMAMRQLLDAGTLSNLPAGFKAKGARIADSDNPIQPGEWRDIDAGGAELTASLLPLPYKEPSQTLFSLLGFVVDAGKRLASIADMQVGEGNQMAAVGTTIALMEKGSMVMSAIHKRLHYSQKMEFQLLAKGFGKYLPDEYPYEVPGASRKIKKQAPMMHNMYEAYYRVYAAMNVRDIDGILRPQNTQMPKDPAQENADVLDQMELKAFSGQQHDAHILSHLIMGMSPMLQANPQAAMTLQKHILDHVRKKAEEIVEAQLFSEYGADPDRMVSPIQKEGMIALEVAKAMMELRGIQAQLSGEGPDPVVQLKQAEIQQRAQADSQRIQIEGAKLEVEKQKAAEVQRANMARVQSQENIAMLRADVARERLNQVSQQQGAQNAS